MVFLTKKRKTASVSTETFSIRLNDFTIHAFIHSFIHSLSESLIHFIEEEFEDVNLSQQTGNFSFGKNAIFSRFGFH